jgi:hypothetical protein
MNIILTKYSCMQRKRIKRLFSVTIVLPIVKSIVSKMMIKIRKIVKHLILKDIAISVQGNAHISFIRSLIKLEEHA